MSHPARIAKQLVYGAIKTRWARPKLTFCNENVLALYPDENIGLALVVESLSSGLPFIVAIELY